MRLETFTLGDLDTNTYLIVDDLTQECAVIDPADDAQFISDEILRQNLKLSKIIATHGHFDHNLATAELQLNFDVPFLIHKDDQFLIEDIASRTKYWLKRDVELKPPQPSAYLEDQMQLRVGSLDFQVVHTPGHTPGCCVLVCKAQEIVFTGDTLFADGVQGRTDFSYSSQAQMNQSLKTIKAKLAGYRGLPGHGEEFIV